MCSYPASNISEVHWSVPADRVKMKYPKHSIGPASWSGEWAKSWMQTEHSMENMVISTGSSKQIPKLVRSFSLLGERGFKTIPKGLKRWEVPVKSYTGAGDFVKSRQSSWHLE